MSLPVLWIVAIGVCVVAFVMLLWFGNRHR
jgi:hypothetical protein